MKQTDPKYLVRREEIRKLVKTPLLVQEAMRDYQELSDEQLIRRFQDGDMKAFDVIVGRYKEPLIHFVLQFVHDRSDAEDIVQDTFVKVFRHKHLYRQIATFSTWIHAVARNFARSEIRKKHRYRPQAISTLSNDSKNLDEWSSETVTDDTEEHRNQKAVIRQVIQTLPEKYREVMLLREVENLPYEQIAKKTGIPMGTVKSRVNRGRQILKKKIQTLNL